MKIIDLTGQKFGQLIVIERAEKPRTRKLDTAAFWKCICNCGKIIIIRGHSLRIGKTKSCGCLKQSAPHLAKYSLPKYSSEIASAKIAWRSRYTDLPFEYFYNICQKNCFYCNQKPQLQAAATRKDSINFIYSTLDRLDSSKGHIIGNVVPCCLICNRGKLTRSIDEFKQHIINIHNNKIIFPEESRALSKNIGKIKRGYKCYYRGSYHSTYDDGNLTFEQFYQLSQCNCYYCGQSPINKRTFTKISILYNGIDRIDNNLPHNYENSVTCCKYCNSAKGTLTLQEFYDWSKRAYDHLMKTNWEIMPQ